MRAFFLALLLAVPAPAAAQQTIEVRLSSFDFAPSAIMLRAGQPIVLHLVNTGRGGHNFSAPEFFAAASDMLGPVRGGTIEVPGHGSVDIRLTPARGTYRLRCTHTLHSTFGMRGTINVH